MRWKQHGCKLLPILPPGVRFIHMQQWVNLCQIELATDWLLMHKWNISLLTCFDWLKQQLKWSNHLSVWIGAFIGKQCWHRDAKLFKKSHWYFINLLCNHTTCTPKRQIESVIYSSSIVQHRSIIGWGRDSFQSLLCRHHQNWKKKPLWIESHIVQFPPILPKKKN